MRRIRGVTRTQARATGHGEPAVGLSDVGVCVEVIAMGELWLSTILLGVFIGGAVTFVIVAALGAAADGEAKSVGCHEPGCGARFLTARGLELHMEATHGHADHDEGW